MASSLHRIATALMVPGDRPDRFDKAYQRCGHAMIIDLEDAVPPDGKAMARGQVAQYLRDSGREDGPLVGVRINALTQAASLDDLVMLRELATRLDFVAVPMVESGRDIAVARAALDKADLPIMAVIETIDGLDAARSISSSLLGQGGIGFGAADYCAQTGMEMTASSLSSARVRIVEAAVSGGVPAFDVPYLAIGDQDGLRAEADLDRSLGFAGKLAIHPSQIDTIIAAFQPTANQVADAEKIIAAFEAAGGKALQLDGRMIDKPLYDQALAIRARSA
jgi:citrate lyase beta subunit